MKRIASFSVMLIWSAIRFEQDRRPHVAIIVRDDHYHMEKGARIVAYYAAAKDACT